MNKWIKIKLQTDLKKNPFEISISVTFVLTVFYRNNCVIPACKAFSMPELCGRRAQQQLELHPVKKNAPTMPSRCEVRR